LITFYQDLKLVNNRLFQLPKNSSILLKELLNQSKIIENGHENSTTGSLKRRLLKALIFIKCLIFKIRFKKYFNEMEIEKQALK
jgi:hypothetical protein